MPPGSIWATRSKADRWVKPEEAVAAKQEAARQKQADKHWKTRLESCAMGSRARTRRGGRRPSTSLAQVTDPRAVPMIWAIFVRGGERQQIAAVQMLGQIDGPSASNGLAALAVFSPAAEVRRRAIETLTRRDPRDVVGRSDRPDSQAIQVSGASRQRAGIAGRALRRGRTVQYSALLSKPDADARAQSGPHLYAGRSV